MLRPITPDGNEQIHEHPSYFFGQKFLMDNLENHWEWEDAAFCTTRILTPEEAKKKIEYYKTDLIKDNYQQLFDDVYPSLGGRPVDECGTLGIGELTKEWVVKRHPNPDSTFKDIENAELINHSLYQLALVMKFIQLLEQKGNSIKRVYHQDPDFMSADEVLLHSLGFEVNVGTTLRKPLTSATFLFAVGMANAGEPEALENAFPAIYIGGELKRYAGDLRELLQDCSTGFSLNMKNRRGEEVIEEFHDATTGLLFRDKWTSYFQTFNAIRVLKDTVKDSSNGKGETANDVIYYRHPDLKASLR